jgi:hypothetical protein
MKHLTGRGGRRSLDDFVQSEEAWSSPRTWQMFQEWFAAEVVEVVQDIGLGRLVQ